MKILIIEDEQVLNRAMTKALGDFSDQISQATSAQEARAFFDERFDLIILDIHLPDGNGVDLAQHFCAQRPMPAVIAVSGKASPSQAFKLKEFGVRGYLPKPFTGSELKGKVAELLETYPDIEPSVVPLVGKTPIREVSTQVRKAMLVQALSETHGNITKAGALLRVSRQAVQQMINEFELDLNHYKLVK